MTNWVPYRRLHALAYRRAFDNIGPGAIRTQMQVKHSAARYLQDIVDNCMDSAMLAPGFNPVIDVPSEFLMEAPLRRSLLALIQRPSAIDRIVLQEFLLFYFCMGLPAEEVVHEAHAEYGASRKTFSSLMKEDVALFCALFWDWRIEHPDDIGRMDAYADAYLKEDYRRIYNGAMSLDELRIKHGVARSFDVSRELTELAQVMSISAKEAVGGLIGRDPLEQADAYRCVGAFVMAYSKVLKTRNDLGGVEDSRDTLKEILEGKHAEMSGEAESPDELYAASPDLLLTENIT